MRILVTGGGGYIGTHHCLELLEAGHQPVVVDNFCNSRPEAIGRVQALAGRAIPVHALDLRDRGALRRVFDEEQPEAVVHLAGLKAVADSLRAPLRYYDNNLGSTLSLLDAMREAGCRLLVFSSSATVYAVPGRMPLREDAPLAAINPYGRSKLMIEQLLRDLAAAEPGWHVALLRYFNPVGAHESGEIGEDPAGVPGNLMPCISQVAVGRRECLRVFGADYPTPDGTGVRDYLHVVDLARGHVRALEWLREAASEGATPINLGTGRGTSVLELVRAFEAACGRAIPCEITDRRPGDAATCYADPARAERLLGWRATRGLADMCRDAWRWQSRNPLGYAGADARRGGRMVITQGGEGRPARPAAGRH